MASVNAATAANKEHLPDLIHEVIKNSRLKFDDSKKTALETLLKDYDMKSEGGDLLIFVGETLYGTTRFEVIQFLIEHGADPTQKDKKFGLTCYQYLILADSLPPSQFGYFSALLGKSKDQMISETVERVRELLFDLLKDRIKKGNRPSELNYSLNFLHRNGGFDYFVKGLTPLMYLTILVGNPLDLDLLLYYGPNLTLETPEGMTAAHFAWLHGYPNAALSKLCGHMRIPEKRIDDEMKELKWKGAGAVGKSDGKHPLFAWFGHGYEELRQMTGGRVRGLPTRNKILPGRILLVAAECGMYTFSNQQSQRVIEFDYNFRHIAWIKDTLEELYSTDQVKAAFALDGIQQSIGAKFHMYREGDEYPEIFVDFDKSMKSGLYKFPIRVEQFLDKGSRRMLDGSASSFEGAIYPTPAALGHVSNMFTIVNNVKKDATIPTLAEELIRTEIFGTSMGKLMEVFGEGIYTFTSCRAILSAYRDIKTMENAIGGLKANVLNTLNAYKNLPTAKPATLMAVSSLPIRGIRSNSLERQKVYQFLPSGEWAGGSTAAGHSGTGARGGGSAAAGHRGTGARGGGSAAAGHRGTGARGGGSAAADRHTTGERPPSARKTPTMHENRRGNTTRGRGRPSGKKTRKLNRQK